ncbi:leucine-rich repeat domain-containing protein [bacterium]|nr:leucine-rich repeat domain-containing protein [bacterium]
MISEDSNSEQLDSISKYISRGIKSQKPLSPEQAYKNVAEIIKQTHGNKKNFKLDQKGLLDLPPEISKLSNLKQLSLRKNLLVELPPEIGSLKKLEVLILNRNQLSSLPQEFSSLSNMSILYIRDNHFSTFPKEITALENLTRLNASFNLINSIPSEISELANLTYLSLAGNEIRNFPPQILKMENLRYLDLRGNCLTEFPYRSLLPNLTHVDLSNNQIPSDELIKNLEIFLSYTREDNDYMQQVKIALKKTGMSVWTDEALIPGTPDWVKEIEKNIKNANAMVVILSPDANETTWVGREISFAEKFEKKIFPILCSGDEMSSIPISLIHCQHVDGRRDIKSGIKKLIESIISFQQSGYR